MDTQKQKFTPVQVQKVAESDGSVIKLDATSSVEIRSFEFQSIDRHSFRDYQDTKAKLGPLAVTDEKAPSQRQDRKRFTLNPVVRSSLAIDEEEKRAVQALVEERIAAIHEELSKKAYHEGLEVGKKAGFDVAYEEFKKKGEMHLHKLNDFLSAAETAKTDLYRANEEFLIRLVYQIAEMVALKEISADKAYVSKLARSLLERMKVKDNVTITIHPKDKESIESLKADFETHIGKMDNLEITLSESVEVGGCRVETDWHAVDASLKMQLDNIFRELIGSEPPVINPSTLEPTSEEKNENE